MSSASTLEQQLMDNGNNRKCKISWSEDGGNPNKRNRSWSESQCIGFWDEESGNTSERRRSWNGVKFAESWDESKRPWDEGKKPWDEVPREKQWDELVRKITSEAFLVDEDESEDDSFDLYEIPRFGFGKSQKRKTRRDILRRRPSRTMGCCSKCNAMTGTREGLEALISNDGYEHYNWYDIQEAAAQGCAFCKFLFDRIEYDDWVYADEDEEDEEVVMRRPIRIIAQMRKLTISDEEGKPHRSHPLEQVQLLGLIVLISKESDVESGERLIREDEKIGRIGDEFYHVVTHKCTFSLLTYPEKGEELGGSTQDISRPCFAFCARKNQCQGVDPCGCWQDSAVAR